MKKIINYIVLIVICILPVMVDAKANFEFDADYRSLIFLNKEKGLSSFYNIEIGNPTSSGSVKWFDSNNEFVKDDVLYVDEDQAILNNKNYVEYFKLLLPLDGNCIPFVDYDSNKMYCVNYLEELYRVFDFNDLSMKEVYFDDDLLLTKNTLGIRYELYDNLTNKNLSINYIRETNGYFVVYYKDSNYDYYISLYDNEFNEILKFNVFHAYDVFIYVHDNLIYVMETPKMIDLYKLDGTKLETLNISYESIDEFYHDEWCTAIDVFDIEIINNDLYLVYLPSEDGCRKRINFSDVNEFAKITQGPLPFTLKYKIDFDVETVSSSNGEFTYEEVVSDDGKSYVDLKVTPKDGYSVEEIIVTDINGNRIEVTNNRFLKPLNDVKVEVKYVKGEYLPIPDTFLGKSVSLIIIGVILISLGFYTINYVRQE